MTILVQSRGPRLNDVLSAQEANEIANVPSGFTSPAPRPTEGEKQLGEKPLDERPHSEKTEVERAVSNIPGLARSVEELEQETQGIRQSVAKIRKDGKVEVEEVARTN
jgi:hypothetical protein